MLVKQRLIWQKNRSRSKKLKEKKYRNIPEKVWKEVGKFVLVSGTKATINRYPKIYPKYDQKHIFVNAWKSNCKNNKESTVAKNFDIPHLLNDQLL